VSGLYGGAHQAIRRALLPYVPGSRCWRCGYPILPGQPWDLGHDDDNPTLYRGPEHARCSRQAGGRKGAARRRANRERIITVDECALAIEVAEDRLHCSIIAAGYLPGELVLLEVVGYLTGTDPVAAVLQLQTERTVLAVAVDPHSHASTCIRPLEAAGITVTRPSSGDVAEAHGLFLDTLASGRIRHQGELVLTAGMRHLSQRRMGQAAAAERRGQLVDVSPAVASELAVWALLCAPKVPLPAIYVGEPGPAQPSAPSWLPRSPDPRTGS
jgi:hypothetical protein